jgi:hypothetical protein
MRGPPGSGSMSLLAAHWPLRSPPRPEALSLQAAGANPGAIHRRRRDRHHLGHQRRDRQDPRQPPADTPPGTGHERIHSELLTQCVARPDEPKAGRSGPSARLVDGHGRRVHSRHMPTARRPASSVPSREHGQVGTRYMAGSMKGPPKVTLEDTRYGGCEVPPRGCPAKQRRASCGTARSELKPDPAPSPHFQLWKCHHMMPDAAQRAVTRTAGSAPAPSAIRPQLPLHGALQRHGMKQRGQEENGPHHRDIPASGPFPQMVAGVGFEPT